MIEKIYHDLNTHEYISNVIQKQTYLIVIFKSEVSNQIANEIIKNKLYNEYNLSDKVIINTTPKTEKQKLENISEDQYTVFIHFS